MIHHKFWQPGLLLSVLFFFFSLIRPVNGQELQAMPHGQNFSLDCQLCHNTNDWTVNKKKIGFNHSKTGYPLLGQHKSADCRSCHLSLEFQKTGTACLDCHEDGHAAEMGNQCQDCHSPPNRLPGLPSIPAAG